MLATPTRNPHTSLPNNLRQRRRLVGRAARAAGCFGLEVLESRTLMSVTFATTDNFQLASGSNSAPYALAADSAGNAYADGMASDSAGTHFLIREKFSGASTWQTILSAPATGSWTCGLSVDAAGNVFASAYNGGSIAHVYERDVGQPSFSLVNELAGTFSVAFAADATGNIYANGWTHESVDNRDHWVVWKKTSGTTSFVQVNDFLGSFTGAGTDGGGSVTVINGTDPSAGVYVVGSADKGGAETDWLVRKSTDGGTTWSTVDDFTNLPGTIFTNAPQAVGHDLSGNLYVVGASWGSYISGYKGKTPIYSSGILWITRKSTDGGASWTTTDSLGLSTTTPIARAYAVGCDLAGNMYVIGLTEDATGVPHSIIRTNAGGTWQTVDNYQLASGKNAIGRAMTIGADGTIYASIQADDAGAKNGSGSSTHWIIRSVAGPTAPLAPAISQMAAVQASTVQPAATFQLAPATPAPNNSPTVALITAPAAATPSAAPESHSSTTAILAPPAPTDIRLSDPLKKGLGSILH